MNNYAYLLLVGLLVSPIACESDDDNDSKDSSGSDAGPQAASEDAGPQGANEEDADTSGSGTGDGGDEPATSDAALVDSGTSTPEAGLPTSVTCDPEGDGVCENEADCEVVESGQARAKAAGCGQGCLDAPEEDRAACAGMCLIQETGLSQGCAACYLGVVACATENCLAECGADPASQACGACQVAAGCISEFVECSGITL